jgi:hypothetical protein
MPGSTSHLHDMSLRWSATRWFVSEVYKHLAPPEREHRLVVPLPSCVQTGYHVFSDGPLIHDPSDLKHTSHSGHFRRL